MPEIERLSSDCDFRPNKAVRCSSRFRGHYADQIEHWGRYFPPDRILILNFDHLRADAGSVCNRFFEFLGLPPHPVQVRYVRNAGGYAHPMEDRCRHYLTEHFRPYNRRLSNLIGEDWGWPS